MKTNIESKNQEIERLEKLAEWLDTKFSIPGTNIRFGLDSLIGLLPFVGDTITLIPLVYLISKAQKFNLPFHVTLSMIANAALDWFIGLVPLFGDIFDIGFKANIRNVKLIKKYAKV